MSSSDKSEPIFQLSSGGFTRMLKRRLLGSTTAEFPIKFQLLVILGVMWLPLVVLTLLAGTFYGEGITQPFITDVVPQVRLLVALPLLLLADMAISPAVDMAIRDLATTGVVPESERNRFQAALIRLTKSRDSVWPDVILLVVAYASTWLFRPGYGDVDVGALDLYWFAPASGDVNDLSTAAWWYVLVSAPIFQFILFRWAWRFLIWARFLYQVSRIPLSLHATHPDLAGGLGTLGLAQQTFAVVFVAFAAVVSSTVAHNMIFEGVGFEQSRLEVFVFIVICVVLIYAPMFFFSADLYTSRRIGLSQYGKLGHQLSDAFFLRWVKHSGADVGKELKDSTDSSTMADYGATFDTVRSMRFIPASLRNVVTTTGALAAPFLPLYLIEFSFKDLLGRLAEALV
ncbi:MAG: hypothetical protein JSU95_19110 [Betaproteobacteria bacterium]|nr:MAG: hypothetical protein JSU95_19110 [Betaproteobacteria bacterium]